MIILLVVQWLAKAPHGHPAASHLKISSVTKNVRYPTILDENGEKQQLEISVDTIIIQVNKRYLFFEYGTGQHSLYIIICEEDMFMGLKITTVVAKGWHS